MQKKILPTLLLIIPITGILVTLLPGCKKDAAKNVSKTTLLTTNAWIFSSATASGIDVSDQVPDCYKDNLVSFSADGTGSIDEGTDVCAPSTAGNFDWSFQNNASTLDMSANIIPGGSGLFQVVALTETSLVLSQETTLIPAPFPVTITVTLVHP